LDKNANNLIVGENPGDNQSKLLKENQDLKKQLTEVKQELVRVSEELKKLKDSLTDKDKEDLAREFIEIQEQNDKLVSDSSASAAEIREHTVKVEDLGKKVNARNVNTETFSTNSPDGKDNSNLLIGGGVALISILTVGFGYYLVKRKKNK
jgi:LPXTG-motif cell wall-anchored protein